MIAKEGKYLLAAFLLTLLLGAAGGQLAVASPEQQAMAALDFPPSLPQALAIAGLQPDEALERSGSVGSMQSHGIIRGNWQYEIAYRYTPQGWLFKSYSATRVAAGRQSVKRQFDLNLIQVPNPGDPGNEENYPPGPADYPTPPLPDAPDQPGNTSTSQRCPYPGTTYDVRVEWTWVPGHFDGKKWVPGHWNLIKYTASLHPADFCK